MSCTMQMMMSVIVVIIIALIMLTVLTLMVATTVHAILDILEMASTAQVYSLHKHNIIIQYACWESFLTLHISLCQYCLCISDINECEQQPSVCHNNAKCEDTEGSYECTCVDGYIGDGTLCTGR